MKKRMRKRKITKTNSKKIKFICSNLRLMSKDSNDEKSEPWYRNLKREYLILVVSISILLSLSVVGLTSSLQSQAEEISEIDRQEALGPSNQTVVVVFYGDTCKYCKNMSEFIKNGVDDEKNMTVKEFEVWNNRTGHTLYHKSIDSGHTGVPAVQIGNETWFGYSEEVKQEIGNKIDECGKINCGIPDTHER